MKHTAIWKGTGFLGLLVALFLAFLLAAQG
jgi:hypothetical protein